MLFFLKGKISNSKKRIIRGFTSRKYVLGFLSLVFLSPLTFSLPPDKYQLKTDWLLDNSPFQAHLKIDRSRGIIILENGLIRRVWQIKPAVATIRYDNLMTGETIIRSVHPEGWITLNGHRYSLGGLSWPKNHAYIPEGWSKKATALKTSLKFIGLAKGRPQERFPWKRVRHHSPLVQWPPPGIYLQLDFTYPESPKKSLPNSRPEIIISLHYELYDGLPLLSKWITVQNNSAHPITVNRFTLEELAVVEYINQVETRPGVPLLPPDVFHLETDMAFGGMTARNANRHTIHWRTDPRYHTQVNYLKKQPCLLVVEPTYGPEQDIQPGDCFESFRLFELVFDSSDRERRGLAQRQMYRTIAPWVTENPLMFHLRTAEEKVVKRAIDQCAEVGFEVIILSFGSGFQAENDDPAYLAQWKQLANYARAKGIHLGCYSLLSSRRVNPEDMIVCPPGQKPTHGQCPALTSRWGLNYFKKLYNLFKTTGFLVFEHDGSYPGDVDITPRPPYQKGLADSRWAQWRIISDFYKWCRGQGIYLNVPDYYFLVGSNKCGLGYRESNWSLPRQQQLIHTRQNIYDGTWEKTPSMGWMFVPLTQYHGGGPAATVEPLDQHLEHYKMIMLSNLAFGVQPCYRGPRLYDTQRVKEMIKNNVAWYKKYRDILESDLIHGRRADGRDIDWMLHVNPRLPEKGLLVVFNPTKRRIVKKIRVPLYYTGLKEKALIRQGEEKAKLYSLDPLGFVDLTIDIQPRGFNWYVITQK